MRLLGKRFLFGPSLNSLVKEHNKNYCTKVKREDFYDKFFTNKEMRVLNPVYMTVYKNQKGKQYVLFTKHLPSPGGGFYNNMESLIGAKTGYNTEVVSCEKCYIIG